MNASANDYYPFGMQMPGRDTIFKNGYRYGFNGKPMDNIPYGLDNAYDYGMRIYDPRVGRFLSVDPLMQKYPELTPYQFASNRPIQGIDLDGEEFLDMIKGELERRYSKLFIAQANQELLKEEVKRQTILALERQPSPQSNPAPIYTPEQQKLHDAITAQYYSDQGYNADGTEKFLTRLSENKHFNNFANNVALPLISVASAYDGLYSLGELGTILEKHVGTSKVNFLRNVLNIKKSQNIGILEGQIGNTKIADIAISGEKSVKGTVASINQQKRVFTTFNVDKKIRDFDSEVKLLENFAETYKSTPNIEGTLKLTSELPFCESCAGVIDQFKAMFPKIKLEVVNGTKY